MSSRQLPHEYPPELLLERSNVLHELAELESPVATGFVVDTAGTGSHEQAIHISEDGEHATLFIVDTTRFLPGGPVDQHGLVGIQSIYSEGDSDRYRQQRLFKDPVLYRRLNMTNPEGCPTIAIAFDKTADGWKLQAIERKRFYAESVHVNGESPEVDRISETERELALALGEHIESLEAEYGIGFIGDTKGRNLAHRPLRQWPDFKNLQLLTRLVVDHDTSVVLKAAATERIRDHIEGGNKIDSVARAAELLGTTASTEMHLLDIVSLPDPRKYKLSIEAFRLFCNSILEGTVDPKKIVGVGSLLGTVTTADRPEADWEEFLISTLQSTDRTENDTIHRNRAILAEMHRKQEMVNSNPHLRNALRQLSGFGGRRGSGTHGAIRRR
jgi:hypothetical protein